MPHAFRLFSHSLETVYPDYSKQITGKIKKQGWNFIQTLLKED
jgi:hypothetical protein